jgi:Cu(I)/Ag(I) efflux system membrane protein CusA/SilA
MITFIAIPVTLSGGFILLWLYAQPWFLNFSLLGVPMREMLHIHSYNLSVAVWVGFIAVFGIATDDGVVMGTYLEQIFAKRKIKTLLDIRAVTVEAGLKRVRPCLMTTATTILALFPVLMSGDRGADVMIPMALPSVGGMMLELITLFVVPACYCQVKEWAWKLENK